MSPRVNSPSNFLFAICFRSMQRRGTRFIPLALPIREAGAHHQSFVGIQASPRRTSSSSEYISKSCEGRDYRSNSQKNQIRTLVPRAAHHAILCVDQSGSMATSVVYSSIFAAVIASIPGLSTKLNLLRCIACGPDRSAGGPGRGAVLSPGSSQPWSVCLIIPSSPVRC